MTTSSPACHKICPADTYTGKQGFDYFEGIARETVGSQAICMHLLTIPPGGRAKAHKHVSHETAIYTIKGQSTMLWGEKLENRMVVGEGELVYIPANVPHLPINSGDTDCIAVIARTDPHEQESVELLPELEDLATI